ncbi:MAG: DUF4080 domain-containing protein [Clostridia bacterium]|nr:DUF4080 domain-containing protein [Clostridia bacterium]
MKFLLCSLNSKYIHSSLAPYYLLSGIREFSRTNVEAFILEGTINEKFEEILSKILSFNADLIGFSVYIWNLRRVKELTLKIKEIKPETKIILGGPEVSYNAGTILKGNKNVDYILSGEGEWTLPILLDAINQNSEIPENKGICYKNQGEIILSEPYIGFSDPPTPYIPEYFENLKGRISYIETSRGCPFHCAFCLSGRCGGVRFFDLNKSLENILLLSKSGSKTIKFIDRTFNANKERAKKIVRFILENYGREIPDDVCFHFEIAGDILDDELISLFGSAPKGSIQLEIGLQSFNEQTLNSVNRKTNTQKLTKNIQKLIKPQNIHIHIDLIAGLPYEGYESFKESFNKAYILKPHMLQFGFLKILHGSDLEKESYGADYSKNPPYEVISTPWIKESELKLLHTAEKSLDILYNSGRFLNTANVLLNKLNITPYDFYFETGLLLEKVNTPMEACQVLLEYGISKGIDKAVIRDILVTDWLSKSPKLPLCLHIPDKNLKRLGILLDEDSSTQREKNVKRSIAILYTQERAVYFDHVNPDRITGRYKEREIPFFGANS